MIRDYSKHRVVWTRHAKEQALEDNFPTSEVEGNISVVVEVPEFEEDKWRGILRVGPRYCTLIYRSFKDGLIVITCWESNHTDIEEYKRGTKHGG
jgi:hypothetical protein